MGQSKSTSAPPVSRSRHSRGPAASIAQLSLQWRSDDDPKILIIGAGAAGLACAMRLLESGYNNVIILEAEQRIGGRIHTIPFADNVIDLGAQWCHGETGNVVCELVARHNVLETSGDVFVTFQCIRSNGEVVAASVVQRLKDIVAEVFADCKDAGLLGCKGTVGEFLTSGFYAALSRPEYADVDRDTAVEFFENYKKVESSDSSSSVDEMSACGLMDYWECEGDYLLNWRDKGYAEFLRLLTRAEQPIGGDDVGLLQNRVRYGTLVDTIEWQRDGGKVRVKCRNTEEVFLVDHVVVTCSLGVLKQSYETLFRPPVPSWKRRAIQAIGFGYVCKIFLEFPQIFWPGDWTGFTTLWRQEDCTELRTSPRAWLEDLFGFYRVNYQPRVLLGWIVGPHVAVVERLPEEEVLSDCLYLLRRFLPNWQIPEPLHVVRTQWQSKSNFAGAYSFRSIETELRKTGAQELSTPLIVPPPGNDKATATKPVVLFAGEATSQHHYSTVHGAVETGWREADRLMDYYSRPAVQ